MGFVTPVAARVLQERGEGGAGEEEAAPAAASAIDVTSGLRGVSLGKRTLDQRA